MLVAAVIVFGLALCLLLVGLRGRRIDDHPRCRKCGFDLVGSYPATMVCPECGRGLQRPSGRLARNPIRIGNRRKRGRSIGAAVLVLLVSGVLAGLLGWDHFSQGGWTSRKPTWWLMLDTRSRAPAAVDTALQELLARQGQGKLSTSQLATLTQRGLDWQADTSLPWLQGWGQFIDDAWQKDRLSESQRTAYAANAFALKFEARPQVRQGDQAPAAVTIQPRGGSGTFDFDLVLSTMTLGEQQLLGLPFHAEGSPGGWMPGSATDMRMEFAPGMEYEAPEGFPPMPEATKDAVVLAEPGRHSLTVKGELRINARGAAGLGGASYTWSRRTAGSPGFGRNRSSDLLAKREVTLTAPVEVLPPNAETVELVKDEALVTAARGAVSVSIQDEPASSYQPAGRRLRISVGAVPADVAMDVTVRGGGKERHSRLTKAVSDPGILADQVDLPRGDAKATYEIVLTPNPALARRTVGMTRIVGSEIVYEGLTVGKSVGPNVFGGTPPAAPDAGIAVVATLVLPTVEWLNGGNHAFRSVALRMPYVYVGDREGDLHVFKIDQSIVEDQPEAVKVLRAVSDGSDLKVVGDTLLLTKHGSLVAYSLKDPGSPELIDTFGPPMRTRSNSLVINGDRGYVLGDKSIICYDLSDPASPGLLSTTDVKDRAIGSGTVVGQHLFTDESTTDYQAFGIGVYDLSKPHDISRVGFVATPQPACSVHTLPDQRILVVLDSASRWHSGPGPHGSTQVFDISDPPQPRLVSETPNAGGRVSVVVDTGGERYLVCPGAVMRMEGDSPTSVFDLFSMGANLDGAAYHGDSDGTYAALAMDSVAVVVRIKKSQ